jgi:hypothetical protein
MTRKRGNLAQNAIHAMSIMNISAPPTEFGYPTNAEFAMKATMLKKLAENKTTPEAPHQTEIQKTIESVQQ